MASFAGRLIFAFLLLALLPLAVGFLQVSHGSVVVGWLGPIFIVALVLTGIGLTVRAWRLDGFGRVFALLLIALLFAGFLKNTIYLRNAGMYAGGALKLNSTQDRYGVLLTKARGGELTGSASSNYFSERGPAEAAYRILSTSPVRAEFDSNHDLRGHQAIYYDPAFFIAHPGMFVGGSGAPKHASGSWSSPTPQAGPLKCIALWDGYGVCTFPPSL